MSPGRLSTAELLEQFEALSDLAPHERESVLNSLNLHVNDVARLRALCNADHETKPGFLDQSAAWHLQQIGEVSHQEIDASSLVGAQIGMFVLDRLIGRGGMAAVFEGHRISADFEQKVAVKLLRRGLHSSSEQQLFQRERQLLAQLEHPSIARLIDGGVTSLGTPFLVLEFVDGAPIDRYAREHRLSCRDIVSLYVRVCRGVAAAHRSLIVHRDIKPSNVLVNSLGEPKLLDFGVATAIRVDESDDDQVHTNALTPAYAAPEQLTGDRVGPPADVYSLGVMLHELLTGRRPEQQRLASELVAPDYVQTATNESPNAWRRHLTGDIDSILAKAMHLEPDRRYSTADVLADDLDNYLQGLAVRAHPPSWLYFFRKFVSRYRVSVGIAAALTLALIGTATIAVIQANDARTQARIAVAEAERAKASIAFVGELFFVDDPAINRGQELTAASMLARGAERLQAESRDPALQAQLEFVLGQAQLALGNFTGAHIHFDRSVSAFRRLDDADPLSLAQALERFALTTQRTGDYSQSVRLLDEALSLVAKLDSADAVRVRLLLTLCDVYRDSGHPKQALQATSTALRLVENSSDPSLYASVLQKHAAALNDNAEFDRSSEVAHRARILFTQLYGERDLRTLGALQTEGWTLVKVRQFEKADALLVAAGAGILELVGDRSERYAINLHNRAILARAMGNHAQALGLFEASDKAYVHVYGEKSLDRGWVLYEAAQSALELNRTTLAIERAQETLAIWHGRISADSDLPSRVRLLLAEAYVAAGLYGEARTQADVAYTEFLRLGLIDEAVQCLTLIEQAHREQQHFMLAESILQVKQNLKLNSSRREENAAAESSHSQ